MDKNIGSFGVFSTRISIMKTPERTVRLTFHVPEAQWESFKKLTIQDAIEQVMGTNLTRKGSRLAYTKVKPTGVNYVTRNAHRYLKKGTPCVIRRSGGGYLVVSVLAKHLPPKANANKKGPEEYVTLTFNGLWYIQGKEKSKLYITGKDKPLHRSKAF